MEIKIMFKDIMFLGIKKDCRPRSGRGPADRPFRVWVKRERSWRGTGDGLRRAVIGVVPGRNRMWWPDRRIRRPFFSAGDRLRTCSRHKCSTAALGCAPVGFVNFAGKISAQADTSL